MTECRDRKSDRTQFHTESRYVRHPYDARTISSHRMQGCRKTAMQNLKDCRKKKPYVVRFPHCSRAVIVRFSVDVSQHSCGSLVIKRTIIVRQSCGFRKTNAWLAKYYVSRTNTLRVLQQSCGSLACLPAVLRLSEYAHKSQRK